MTGDPEGSTEVSRHFTRLNEALEAAGHKSHRAPVELDESVRFSCDMRGYSGLHRLRRIAAHAVARLFQSRSGDSLRFQHLIVHSDAEGYYVPQDFSKVIFPTESLKIPGAMIGSVPRLQEECRALAELLEIPDGLDAESDEVLEAAENPESGAAHWQLYGIESFSCIRLLTACHASLNTGAAIVFC